MATRGNHEQENPLINQAFTYYISLFSEPRLEIVRQEPSEECSISAGLLDLATAPATDPEEEILAKQYVKKKKKPQRVDSN